MPESEDKPPPCEAARPDWACGKFFQCSLLPRGVLWNTPSDTEDEAEEILAGFFYRVPAEEAGEVNLGVLLVCERLTLYLVLNGMPQSFATLIQVCPPFGSSMEVSASGTGGAVMWSDMALQRILRYDCTGTNGDERHLLRYARYVRHLAKPSFAALPAVEEEGVSAKVSSEPVETGQKIFSKGVKTQMGEGGRVLVSESGSTIVGVGGKAVGGSGTAGAARETAAAGMAGTAGRIKVIREGESLEYDGKKYAFGGSARWRNMGRMATARGEFVACDKGLKGLFANNKEAKAFYDAAIEAEGLGRNGTGRYRLRF